MSRVVVDISAHAEYNDIPPYHPDTAFPELPFTDTSASSNRPYHQLRALFLSAGYDTAHAGTRDWNPLGHIIRPGETVLLKPNFVLHRNFSGGDLFASITHPSILRALIDYTFIALQGRGRIIIADAPQMDCSWDALSRALRLDAVQEFYRTRLDFDIEVYDLRPFEVIDSDQPAFSTNRRARPGDPAGGLAIDLGNRSAFRGMETGRFYGADFDRRETLAHHRDGMHTYCVSQTVMNADVVISVPKMKVHKKVGVTLNLKGLVGINTNKNCLVHYRLGSPCEGGDQLPDAANRYDAALIRGQRKLFDALLAKQTRVGDWLYRIARQVYRTCLKPFRPVSSGTRTVDGGNWYGNDTAWRMTADLAAIFYFADRTGVLHPARQRKMLCIIDGIIGGEGEGPLAPDARPTGTLVLGEDPLAVDIVTTRLMGLDPEKIKTFLVRFSNDWKFDIKDFQSLEISINGSRVDASTFFRASWHSPVSPFRPHPGWIDHIEIPQEPL